MGTEAVSEYFLGKLGKILNIRLDQKQGYGWMKISLCFNLSIVKLVYNEYNIFYEEKRNRKTFAFLWREISLW